VDDYVWPKFADSGANVGPRDAPRRLLNLAQQRQVELRLRDFRLRRHGLRRAKSSEDGRHPFAALHTTESTLCFRNGQRHPASNIASPHDD
jgi:hypothetical protein